MQTNNNLINNITFVIFTYNEENRIDRVIKNFTGFGKILVADNMSTDKTQEIAKSYGCDILVRTKHYDYVENQEMLNLIYDAIDTEWIYWGFADEMLDRDTLLEINKIITGDRYDIINIDRKNYYYGKFCYNAFSSRTNKIFKVNCIDFTDNKIHGFGKPTVPASKIYLLPDKYFVHHFISNNAATYLNTINKYTDTEQKFYQSHKATIIYPVTAYIICFIKHFILKRGYKAGYAGFVLTLLTVNYIIIKNIKLYETSYMLTTDSIESKNNYVRDNILREAYNE